MTCWMSYCASSSAWRSWYSTGSRGTAVRWRTRWRTSKRRGCSRRRQCMRAIVLSGGMPASPLHSTDDRFGGRRSASLDTCASGCSASRLGRCGATATTGRYGGARGRRSNGEILQAVQTRRLLLGRRGVLRGGLRGESRGGALRVRQGGVQLGTLDVRLLSTSGGGAEGPGGGCG